jgi:uncharacterized protein YndB with AHSA1/START domain
MKARHAVIHDTFTLERRYPSAPAKVYRYFSETEYRKRWFGSTEDWSQRSQAAPSSRTKATYGTEHGAYFDGNPESPRTRVHGIAEQLDLLGRVLHQDQN